MSDQQLETQLIHHEGIEPYAYQDILGYWSVGIGFCIDKRKKSGLCIDECMLILRYRLANLKKTLSRYSWYSKQDDVRKEALVQLAYNLGVDGLLTFKKCLAAMDDKNYLIAATELVDSKWATQVQKDRVNDLFHQIKEGTYANENRPGNH